MTASFHSACDDLLTFAHDSPVRPGWPKLKTSCKACANSKLKCSQGKPSCTRCSKRGIPCEYTLAKKGGRKAKKRIVGSDENQVPENEWYAGLALPGQSGRGLDCSRTSRHTFSESPDIERGIGESLNYDLSATFQSSGLEICGRFDNPTVASDMYDLGSLEAADFLAMDIDFQPSILEAGISESSFPLDHGQVRDGDETVPDVHALGLDCHGRCSDSRTCLVHALELMKQLSAAAEEDAVEGMILQNDVTIEAMGRMLECTCTKDRYLLAILSLLMFKIIERYAKVAHRASGSSEPLWNSVTYPWCISQARPQTANISGYRFGGADSPRMAAQLILSELSRVRRLVTKLSTHLKTKTKERNDDGVVSGTATASIARPDEVTLEMTIPLSEDIDVDLSKKLRTLSAHMINTLRRF